MKTKYYSDVDKHGNERTPYAVVCHGERSVAPEAFKGVKPCGLVYLNDAEYDRQISQPDSYWSCPICMGRAWWDDENYEEVTIEAN